MSLTSISSLSIIQVKALGYTRVRLKVKIRVALYPDLQFHYIMLHVMVYSALSYLAIIFNENYNYHNFYMVLALGHQPIATLTTIWNVND